MLLFVLYLLAQSEHFQEFSALLKDRNLAMAPRWGPEISSRVCLWVTHRRTTDTTHYKHACGPLQHP